MFERLIRLVREEKVSLFIGAGFSIEAQAPSVRVLCDTILSQIDDKQLREEHKKDPLPDLANFFVEDICCGSRNSLIDLLQQKFNFVPAKMNDHQALAKIPHFHNIFTTNYDTLLEDSYDTGERQVIRKDVDCTYIDESKPVRIFKIHGDFLNQDFVVITSQDYKDYFKKNPNHQMWEIVKREFLTKHILFIGYSLADSNIVDIIKNISRAVNKNQKDMFLIAPGLNKSRQKQLKKMKVHYFDAYAAEFFAVLTKALQENIVKDFRHHKVSAETFSRFCHLNNIDPDISLKRDKDNEVVKYKSVDGRHLQQSINMTINDKSKKIFESGDFEKYGVIVKDSPLPQIPYMRFSGKDLLQCRHLVNNIVMNDEIAAVFVGPSLDNFPMTINIPSRNFFEKVVAQKYCPKKDKAIITLDCHIYKMEIIVDATEKHTKGTDLRFTFNFTFEETYTDNNKAIKWIDLIGAMYANEDVFIKEIYDMPFNTTDVFDKQLNKYNDYKTYYENIKQIEMLSGVNFTTYNGCDEKNYVISCIIVAYLTHHPINISCPNGFNFSTKAKISSDFVEVAEKGLCISVVSTECEQQEYILNGHTFIIPYTFIIFNSCNVTNIVQKDDGFMDIDFQYKQDTYIKYFSDKPVAEEFPSLSILET